MTDPSSKPLWSWFYKSNPYDGFPLEDHPADTQGWGSRHPVFEHAIATYRPELIIEVGTWKGASALHMASIARRLMLPTQILCVDTWLGAPEHILRDDYYESLRMRNGYPQLFHTFMANVLREGYDDLISPLPQTSENAAAILRRRGLRADVIYIDAAHEYEPAARDLEAYWPLLTANGLLFGDDYPKAPGVVRAVHEFADRHGLLVYAGGGKFALLRETDPALVELGMDVVAQPATL
jgi:hypothetical protein